MALKPAGLAQPLPLRTAFDGSPAAQPVGCSGESQLFIHRCRRKRQVGSVFVGGGQGSAVRAEGGWTLLPRAISSDRNLSPAIAIASIGLTDQCSICSSGSGEVSLPAPQARRPRGGGRQRPRNRPHGSQLKGPAASTQVQAGPHMIESRPMHGKSRRLSLRSAECSSFSRSPPSSATFMAAEMATHRRGLSAGGHSSGCPCRRQLPRRRP